MIQIIDRYGNLKTIGLQGHSGYSGLSGHSGYSGYSGSGVSGYSGYSGTGTSGYSGYSGYSGFAAIIDFSWREPVISRLSSPPAATLGNRYIVLPTGSGAWLGHDNDIATGTGVGWTYETPSNGWAAYVTSENLVYTFNDTIPAWVSIGNPVSGFSGYSGTGSSGYSGYSGKSGYSGYSGSGLSGYSGYSGSGVSGFSGFSGRSGFSGAGRSGFSGYSGILGRSGYSGFSGLSGRSGYSGYSGSGLSGYSGFSGAGTSGFSGRSGFSGYSGKSGYSGFSGAGGSGYSGYSGSGVSGYSGFSGVGTSGYSGYSGTSTSGFSGYSGSGVSGYSGYSGSGLSGYSGFSGSGLSGYSGFSGSGTSGYSGYSGSGLSGYSGYSGSGLSGYSGFSGSGLSGYSGYSGTGTSGYSGFSGDSGLSGYSGFSGLSGYSGFSGVSGYSGYSGFSGFSGVDGTLGTSGFSGFSGKSGYSGFSGISGYSGFSGSGLSGYSGFSGTGTSGFSGYSGLSGYSGFSGLSGYSGFSGLSGYSGYSGLSGYSGYSGSGVSGYSGFSGAASAPALTATQIGFGDGSNLLSGSANLTYASNAITSIGGTIGATTVDGFVLKSGETASNGAQKWSPLFRVTSVGWSSINSASRPIDFAIYNESVQGTTNPSMVWHFAGQINGGGWSDGFTYTTPVNGGSVASGTLNVPGVITCGSNSMSSATNQLKTNTLGQFSGSAIAFGASATVGTLTQNGLGTTTNIMGWNFQRIGTQTAHNLFEVNRNQSAGWGGVSITNGATTFSSANLAAEFLKVSDAMVINSNTYTVTAISGSTVTFTPSFSSATASYSITSVNGGAIVPNFSIGDNGIVRIGGTSWTNQTAGFILNTSIAKPYVAKTTTYSIGFNDYAIECTSGTFTVTLPDATTCTGREYFVTNSGSGTITLGTTSSQTFANQSGTPTTLSIAQFGGYMVKSNGTNWIVMSKF
jgi:collagen type IV alpha